MSPSAQQVQQPLLRTWLWIESVVVLFFKSCLKFVEVVGSREESGFGVGV